MNNQGCSKKQAKQPYASGIHCQLDAFKRTYPYLHLKKIFLF